MTLQPPTHDHRWSWLTPYCLVFATVAIGGVFLSTHHALQTLSLAPLPFPASTATLLTTYSLCVGLILLAARRASTLLRSDHEGEALARILLQPLTLLLLCLAGSHKLGDLLTPWASDTTVSYASWASLAALAGSALWLATVWLHHTGVLSRLVHKAPQPTADDDSIAGTLDEAVADDDLPPLNTYQADASSKPIAEPAPTATSPIQEGLGRTVGTYALLSTLADDGCGMSYRAREHSSRQLVTVKTLSLGEPAAAETAVRRTHFLREANALTRLSHPNLVATYEVGTDKDLGYLAMEPIDGTQLSAFCKAGHSLSLSQAINIIATVADALDYAHRQGMVHRGISPASIVMTDDHRIKVIDFALPSYTDARPPHISDTLPSNPYRAPECASGKPIDGRADMFSLGMVLTTLLATPAHVGAHTATQPPGAAGSLRADVPAGVVYALERAMQTDPARRYRTAGEFAQALRVGLLAAAA